MYKCPAHIAGAHWKNNNWEWISYITVLDAGAWQV